MKLSIVPQIVETSAPSTERPIAFSRAASTIRAAALYLSRIAGYSMKV